MKKILAVFLAVLTVFSLMTFVVHADEEPAAPTTTAQEEKTTRNILTEDGNVVPVNETQLKFAFVFKLVEKVVAFIMGIFGKEVDETIAGGIDGFAKWIDEAISNLSDGLQE